MNEDAEQFLLELEHAGVKGMKWGVRRERRNQGLTRAGVRVRDGGHVSSKLRATHRLGPVDFVKGRGIVGGAKRKSARVQGQLDRKAAGKATTMDLVKRYGSTRVSDLIPVRESKAGKMTTHKADIAVVTAFGALMALRILSTAAQRKALA